LKGGEEKREKRGVLSFSILTEKGRVRITFKKERRSIPEKSEEGKEKGERRELISGTAEGTAIKQKQKKRTEHLPMTEKGKKGKGGTINVRIQKGREKKKGEAKRNNLFLYSSRGKGGEGKRFLSLKTAKGRKKKKNIITPPDVWEKEKKKKKGERHIITLPGGGKRGSGEKSGQKGGTS